MTRYVDFPLYLAFSDMITLLAELHHLSVHPKTVTNYCSLTKTTGSGREAGIWNMGGQEGSLKCSRREA